MRDDFLLKLKNRHKRYVTCDDVVEMAVIALRNELRSAQCGCFAFIEGGFDYAAHLHNKKQPPSMAVVILVELEKPNPIKTLFRINSAFLHYPCS